MWVSSVPHQWLKGIENNGGGGGIRVWATQTNKKRDDFPLDFPIKEDVFPLKIAEWRMGLKPETDNCMIRIIGCAVGLIFELGNSAAKWRQNVCSQTAKLGDQPNRQPELLTCKQISRNTGTSHLLPHPATSELQWPWRDRFTTGPPTCSYCHIPTVTWSQFEHFVTTLQW